VQDDLPPYYQLQSQTDTTLQFESRFETGNLEKGAKMNEGEYNLLLSNDINSRGHTQWFFFRVRNTRAHKKVKFNIVNFVKPDSLYNHGMKILIYSEKFREATGVGWFRGGERIRYSSNGIKRIDVIAYKTYQTLSFTYTFKFTGDTVYFANSHPYTFSQMNNYLRMLDTNPEFKEFVNIKPVCRTLAGNRCD
jgi:hypothetical protein